MRGKIKRIIRERGFGFISAEDGREIFFHRSALEERATT
jgi:cold shock CspA family protein